jgi:hypothetical protein
MKWKLFEPKDKNHYGAAKPKKSTIMKKQQITRSLYSQPFAVVTLLNYNKQPTYLLLSQTLRESSSS